MKARLFLVLLGSGWLGPTAGLACAVCRPKVQAAIHNADYSVNILLLLLPVVVLLLFGLGLYHAAALWPRRRPYAAR